MSEKPLETHPFFMHILSTFFRLDANILRKKSFRNF